jgi:hypothetical protein
LEYTIFSTAGKTNESMLRIEALREAGIGELLIDEGKITDEEMYRIIDKLEEEYY